MSSLGVDYERAALPGAALEPADEFVEFWHTGTIARGLFCCVSCGRQVVSARVLPPCPSCDGRLWEELVTSPFGMATDTGFTIHEAWTPSEVDDRERFLRSLGLALVIGPAIWVMLAGLAFMLYALTQA